VQISRTATMVLASKEAPPLVPTNEGNTNEFGGGLNMLSSPLVDSQRK
jgi:hypothetical protein